MGACCIFLFQIINPANLMKTHITGVLSHGHGMLSTFLDLMQYPHDPNLTMNIILKMLWKIVDLKVSVAPINKWCVSIKN